MNVIIFGDKPAPAMAQIALKKTSVEGEAMNPRAAQTVKLTDANLFQSGISNPMKLQLNMVFRKVQYWVPFYSSYILMTSI